MVEGLRGSIEIDGYLYTHIHRVYRVFGVRVLGGISVSVQ